MCIERTHSDNDVQGYTLVRWWVPGSPRTHPTLLSEREFGVANAVCRNVNRIFKKSDPPTDEGLLVGMTPFSQNYGLGQQHLWVAIRLTMSPIRLIVNLYKVDSNSLEILQLW